MSQRYHLKMISEDKIYKINCYLRLRIGRDLRGEMRVAAGNNAKINILAGQVQESR